MNQILTSESINTDNLQAVVAAFRENLDGMPVTEFSSFDAFYLWAEESDHYEGQDSGQVATIDFYRAVYDQLLKDELHGDAK